MITLRRISAKKFVIVGCVVLALTCLAYLTSREQLVYELLMPSITILLIISILLNHWWKQFPIHKVSTRLRE